jgi:hypothetical protein
MLLEQDDTSLAGDEVYFDANMDGRVYQFIMTKETIDDLVNGHTTDSSRSLNRSAIFIDYMGLIALVAQKLIEAEVGHNAVCLNKALIDHWRLLNHGTIYED